MPDDIYCPYCGDMVWEKYFQGGPYGGDDHRCVKDCDLSYKMRIGKWICNECLEKVPYA